LVRGADMVDASFWTDFRLALILIVFVYIVQWTISQTGSKKTGVIVGTIVAYLSIFRHWELLVFIIIFFFGYNFFYRLEEASRI
jgi:ABC-type amino acid transport system permease subunit